MIANFAMMRSTSVSVASPPSGKRDFGETGEAHGPAGEVDGRESRLVEDESDTDLRVRKVGHQENEKIEGVDTESEGDEERRTRRATRAPTSNTLSIIDISLNDILHDGRSAVDSSPGVCGDQPTAQANGQASGDCRSVDFAAAGEGPAEGDLVGVFEVSTDRQT